MQHLFKGLVPDFKRGSIDPDLYRYYHIPVSQLRFTKQKYISVFSEQRHRESDEHEVPA